MCQMMVDEDKDFSQHAEITTSEQVKEQLKPAPPRKDRVRRKSVTT